MIEIRGGVPRNRLWTVTSTPQYFVMPNAPTKYLQLFNQGANPVRIYWTAADAAANQNYIELAATGTNGAAIWQSGGGMVSDGPGRIFFATGNGGAPTTARVGSNPPTNCGERRTT